MPGQLGGAPLCPVCDNRVYFNEEKSFRGQRWHKKCFKCSVGSCRKTLETSTANLEADTLYCNQCFRKLQQPNTTTQKQEYVNKEDPECCPRCGKRVYFAEQYLNLHRKWHKSCHTCALCNKKVDSTTAADHQQEVYCKSCYGKNFGPKGYGYAGGAGTMLSMDTGKPNQITRENVPHTDEAYMVEKVSSLDVADNGSGSGIDHGNGGSSSGFQMPRWGGGEYCARCDKQVFIAEKQQGAGNVYHTKCFTCAECNCKLDSSKLTEKETEIYCKACYGKLFAPKGYGFGGGAGTLQMS